MHFLVDKVNIFQWFKESYRFIRYRKNLGNKVLVTNKFLKLRLRNNKQFLSYDDRKRYS